ncbi:hypothetical protein MferCBS31731_005075 [Microsporum ferrugineum]
MASTPVDTLTASTRLRNHRRPSSLWPSAAWNVDCQGASTPPWSCGPFSTRAGPTLPLQHLCLPFAGQEDSPDKKPGSVISQQGYFRGEVETLDPQQRMLLEVTSEALDDAGETGWRGSNIGVYVGSYGQDWYDVSVRDTQAHGIYQILGPHDFMISNRV